ncbi:MAG: 2OG-Fe(II) oxygenase [Sphingobium sp.]
MLGPGDPVSSLYLRTTGNPRYSLDSVAGRYVVLTFLGGTRAKGARPFLDRLYASQHIFDDSKACCFLVISDPSDEAKGRVGDRYPGIRVAWDDSFDLARAFGVARDEGGGTQLRLVSVILDPGLRVCDVVPFDAAKDHLSLLQERIAALPDPSESTGVAPVLMVPNLIEPELCRAYITYAQQTGLTDSGYMKTDPATGNTVLVVDHAHKSRSDCMIDDEALRGALQARIKQRLIPQIERAFQFRVTRMERYLIARYDAQSGGWFRPHKDNTTMGTAHRRFAVSINLNAEDYDGGELRFPEFGPRTHRPPTGGAIVFSCSLLHEATPVTRGSRYCILPFLYDEAAAQIRLENARYLDDPNLRDSVVKSVTAQPA